jgi:hypothetical protein
MEQSFNHLSQSPLVDPNGDRFGEVLSRFVTISRHDVYEILDEQSATRRKFGQIALNWHLCEPQHVWQAWSSQLLGRTPRVDLDRFGVDSQAAADLPAWVAVALGVVPVRTMDQMLVVAASEKSLARAAELLTAHTRKPLSFVLADASQVEAAVQRYYASQIAPPLAGDTCGPVTSTLPACASKRCGVKCKGGGCVNRRKLLEKIKVA